MQQRKPTTKRVQHAVGAALAVSFGFSSIQALAQAAPAALSAPPKAALCISCHGASGQPTLDPAYPILSGQSSRYLYLELKDFNEGRRSNPLMTPMAATLTRDEMHDLADYFAQQKPPRQSYAVDDGKARLGKSKADETLCTMCHLGGFLGQNEIPRVAGQNYAYIVKQLTDFKARTRTNDAGSMTSVAQTLSPTDIENLANYLVGL
jgi:cytochrome c553